MGWKTPGTVAALDSGSGFAIGSVNTYTDNPTGPLGTPLHTAAGFQFPDGISGDTAASLINWAYYAAQGGNLLTEQGGMLALAAGSHNGVQGPELDLSVEGAPAGGYQAVARLRNAVALDLGGAAVTGLSLASRRVTVRKTSTATIGSSNAVPTVLAFDTGTNPAGWSAANPTWLQPCAGAGDYDLGVFVPWSASSAGTTRGIAFRINGGAWQWVENRPPQGGSFGSEQVATYPGITLAANAVLEVGVWQDSGAALVIASNSAETTRASLTRVD